MYHWYCKFALGLLGSINYVCDSDSGVKHMAMWNILQNSSKDICEPNFIEMVLEKINDWLFQDCQFKMGPGPT